MKHLLEVALKAIRRGETTALATIVRAQGSTPRATGAKMLVFRDGKIEGTLGGGEMEQRVIQEAQAALEAGRPRLVHYAFHEVEQGDVGVCGGENDVYIEVLGPAKELLIVGAGHVGQAVARLGDFIGLDCVVFDTRPEYANPERFPAARHIVVGEIGAELRQYPVSRQSYIVIVTRGHLQDAEALGAVIRSPAAYIGMIGSQRKTLRIIEMVKAQGIEPELLDCVHAPIGLDIGAETPEEIAVSIMAQIIAVMAGRVPSRLQMADHPV